jgi:hypothetical protein
LCPKRNQAFNLNSIGTILSIVGALNVLSVSSFDWSVFWLAFIMILVGSFVPEWSY